MNINFSALDQFPKDPNPNVKGDEVLSFWLSKICSILVIVGGFLLALPILYHLTMQPDELPIEFGSDTIKGKNLSPFLLIINFQSASDVGLLDVRYRNDSTFVQKITCPEGVPSSQGLSECYQTRQMLVETQSSILLHANGIFMFQVCVQILSLDHELKGDTPKFVKSTLTYDYLHYLSFEVAEIQIYNSLISDQPTSIIRKISDLDILINSGLEGEIIYSSSKTYPKYVVSRFQLTKIIASWVSWIQSLISICAIIIPAFNILAMKMTIAYYIYSRVNKDKDQSKGRLWLAGTLNIFRLGWLAQKAGWLQKQRKYLDVEDKIQIQNIFVAKNFLLQNNDLQQLVKEDLQSSNASQSLKLIDVSETDPPCSEKGFKFDLHENQKKVVKKNKFFRKFKEQPSLTRKVLTGLLTSLNANQIKVSFDCKHQYKSSTLSVILTLVGLASVVVILFFMGAFSFNANESISTVIKELNTFTVGPNQNSFFLYLSEDGSQQLQIFDAVTQVQFLLLDRYYNIIAIFQPQTNCTSGDPYFKGMMYNFCLNNSIQTWRNSDSLVKFSIRVSSTQLDKYVVIQYKNSAISERRVFSFLDNQLYKLGISYHLEYEVKILTQIIDDDNKTVVYNIQNSKQVFNSFCQGATCIIFSLNRQQKLLDISTGSIVGLLSNIWSITLLVFGLCFVSYISFYNSQTAKTNIKRIIEKIKETEQDSQVNQKQYQIFGIQNILASIYSKLNIVMENNPDLVFLKRKVQ